ncbi:MAG: hypothetical protein L0Y56_10985, partial [Nitrospira sp.]|nr:hypothetical protein [Nitrospira sp.]
MLETNDQLTTEEAKKLDENSPKTIEPTVEGTKLFFEAIFPMANEARLPRQRVWEKAWDLYNG